MNSLSDSRSMNEVTKKKLVVNPYLCRMPDPHRVRFTQPPSLMGLNSRQRVGAVKASKRFGAGRNKTPKKKNLWKNSLGTRGTLPDGVCFNPLRHCVVCRAVSLGCAKPHRAHHERCNRNKATKGRVPESIQQVGPAKHDNHSQAATQSTLNFAPQICNMMTVTEDVLTISPIPNVALQENIEKPNNQPTSITGFKKGVKPSLGTLLRNVLQEQYALLLNNTPDKKEKLTSVLSNSNKTLPTPIALLFSYLTECTQISRRAKQGSSSRSDVGVTLRYAETLSDRYKYFPQGTCIFTFPPDPSLHPFPPYHSIEGMSVFLLDWESMFPDMVLPKCMAIGCNGELSRTRTNFSKSKHLFPVFVCGGLPMWGSVMMYQCGTCNALFNGNDGCFLAKLDDRVASAYPVEPRYALGNYRFHLSRDITEDLESTMLTNGSGDSFCKKMHRWQCNNFKRVIKTYASKAKNSRMKGGNPDEWTILFEEWNGKFVPSGAQLRSYYLDGEKSRLTPYGYSQQERYKRELQQVGRNSISLPAILLSSEVYLDIPIGSKRFTGSSITQSWLPGVASEGAGNLAISTHVLK